MNWIVGHLDAIAATGAAVALAGMTLWAALVLMIVGWDRFKTRWAYWTRRA